MLKRLLIFCVILGHWACADKDPDDTDDTDDGGACGDVTTHSLAVTGRVELSSGDPADTVDVWLEDRGWNPGTTLGQGTTDSSGAFTLENLTITGVEDCWATLLDYVIVSESEGLRGEKEINHQLYNAIEAGEEVADVSALPIVLESSD